MTPTEAAPLLQRQLHELRTAARETDPEVDAGAGSPDWSAHAKALEWCMTQAGVPTDQ